MNIIDNNPFRVLGVFANDTIMVRTANIAKIRAYLRIGKKTTFNSDVENLFGNINRSTDDVESAIAKLTSKTDEVIYSLFWLHYNSTIDNTNLEKLTLDNAPLFVESQSHLSEYTGIINAAVVSLEIEDYELAAQYYSEFFESDNYFDLFREKHGLTKKIITNKELIKNYIIVLCDEFDGVDWWPLFQNALHKNAFVKYIKSVFKIIAIERINKNIDISRINKVDDKEQLTIAKSLYKKSLPHIQLLLSDNEKEDVSAEAQIALDKLCNELISRCKIYYNIAKYENEQSVLPTMQLAKNALELASNSETINIINSFIKELEEDAKKLPPKEVVQEANIIKQEIQSFCYKNDKIDCSFALINNCVAPLLSIKKKLGRLNPYYLSISTKIADNALYNSNSELHKATRLKNENTESYDEYICVLKKAWRLHLNLIELDVLPDFRERKLKKNEEDLKSRFVYEGIAYNNTENSVISLQTDEDIYADCFDYMSLIEFCRKYPNSIHFNEAMQRIWRYEDDAYPKVISIKELFNYKVSYPNSHNDKKILAALDNLLFEKYGSINDYQTLLHLYPNHEKKEEALKRIEYLEFLQCKTIEQYKQYLSKYRNGLYRKQAENKIDDLAFSSCKTAIEFNRYLIYYPNGAHTQEAMDRIEDIHYSAALKSNDYDKYLQQYPNGKYSSQIHNRLEYDMYNNCHSSSDYKLYLKKYPNGRFSQLAKNALKKQNKIYYFVGGVLATCFIIIGYIAYISNYSNNQTYDFSSAVSKGSSSSASGSNSGSTSRNQSTTNTSSYTTNNQVRSAVNSNSSSNSNYTNSSRSTNNPATTPREPSEKELYGNIQLPTGSQPYSSYFGRDRTGTNYLSFKTSGNSDYVIIVRRSRDSAYMNHIYVRGGDATRLYLPDGTYIVYFYSGKGWNPNKKKGNVEGGFVSNESQQKDGPVELYSAYIEYTLYPVTNGNLTLQSDRTGDMFD